VDRVLEDVGSGFVSVERAHLDYGVVVREDGTVDEERTNALRKELANGLG
jgi:hypothetical protein